MKILSVLALSASVLTAAPYVGLSIGYSSIKDNLKYSGHDQLNNVKPTFDHSKSSRLNSVMFGLLGGYAFKMSNTISLLSEVDVSFGSKKRELAEFESYPEGEHLGDVAITTSRKHSLGFMPAVSYNFSDKLSGLFGVRLNWTKYEVTGHVKEETDPQALVKKSRYVMGFEPTVGLGFQVNDKIATRLTVGYNFGQKKTMINQIVTDAYQLADDESSGKITIKPRGINVRVAMTYSF